MANLIRDVDSTSVARHFFYNAWLKGVRALSVPTDRAATGDEVLSEIEKNLGVDAIGQTEDIGGIHLSDYSTGTGHL